MITEQRWLHRHGRSFDWSDPLLLDEQLTEEERMVRDTARAYCQEQLAPRVLEMFRHERPAPAIFREMGALDLLGIVIPEPTAAPAWATSATGWSRAKSSGWTRASAR